MISTRINCLDSGNSASSSNKISSPHIFIFHFASIDDETKKRTERPETIHRHNKSLAASACTCKFACIRAKSRLNASTFLAYFDQSLQALATFFHTDKFIFWPHFIPQKNVYIEICHFNTYHVIPKGLNIDEKSKKNSPFFGRVKRKKTTLLDCLLIKNDFFVIDFLFATPLNASDPFIWKKFFAPLYVGESPEPSHFSRIYALTLVPFPVDRGVSANRFYPFLKHHVISLRSSIERF